MAKSCGSRIGTRHKHVRFDPRFPTHDEPASWPPLPYASTPHWSPSHNAYVLETVTVRYRWHPLYGQALRVLKRERDRHGHGEYLFCELPDRTSRSLPAWMFSSESTAFSVGPPAIAIEALSELRDLLSSLLKSSPCDKASATSPLSQEENIEIASEVRPSATQSRVARSQADDGTSVGRTTRTRPRSDRATCQRRRSRRRSK
jgi:hypothetical protein